MDTKFLAKTIDFANALIILPGDVGILARIRATTDHANLDRKGLVFQ